MESTVISVKTKTIRCPECLNYMKVKMLKVGAYSGTCPVCRSSVFSKQHSQREKHIKIVKNIL